MPHDIPSAGRERAWSWSLADWDRMWRPSMWLADPPEPAPIHWLHLGLILSLVFYANVISNEILDDIWHIPFHLGVLGIAVVIARSAGTTWTAMGLRPDRAMRGLRVGGVVIGIIAVGIIIGVALPFTRDFFRDEAIAESSVAWVLFQALIRIPIATALYEEVLFRGVVFGMLTRRTKPLIAGITTSVLFGMWHILPTLDTIETNPAGDAVSGPVTLAIAVVVAILGTGVAGLAFLYVRLYANSTWASVLAHIGTNSLGMLGALAVIHLL